MITIDIGCGRKKIAGAIGIDFSSMSNADIVLDLNHAKLPFEDNSVDFAFSSHALEHLTIDGFLNVLKEVYRILKPTGQFKIVVPYFTTTTNFANPFHNNNICFNEHTFRFFSSDYETEALEKYEYQTPSCPQWGLRYSANSELGIEFRTLKVGFFYFPEYRDLDNISKYHARSTKTNVVDQIIYTLEPVKPCPVRPETGPVGSSDDPHEFIKRQIDYLQGQITWLESREIFTEEVFIAKEYVLETVRIGDLYKTNKILSPAKFFIFEMDDLIQCLRRLIDSHQ